MEMGSYHAASNTKTNLSVWGEVVRFLFLLSEPSQ